MQTVEMRTPIVGINLDEISLMCERYGGNSNDALKLAHAIYRKRTSSFDQINNISKQLLTAISNEFDIGNYPCKQSCSDSDGSTKQLFENAKMQRFEAVFMPSEKRKTLCVSSQSGCPMACKFCLTGTLGFGGNLTATDILNQVLSIPLESGLNRIVYMGMGEPFDNYIEVVKSLQILIAEWGLAFGRSNITLSTVGLLPELKQFIANPLCNLAISLHSPFHEQRVELMPIERKYPIVEVVEMIRQNPFKKPLRVSFEYVALAGVNMSENHAIAIAQLLKGIRYHLNIIPWNQHSKSEFCTPSEGELAAFISHLNAQGVLTVVRQSRANSINAACGQMAAKNYDK